MLRRGAACGFTLVEVLVSLAIVGLLLALGLPALTTYSVNSKIRAAADNFSADLQSARTEAIRTNGNVALVLTSDAALSANVGSGNVNAAGPNWIVRAGTAAPYAWVAGRTLADLGATLALSGSVYVASPSPPVTSPLSSVNFTPLGGTNLAGTASFLFTAPGSGVCLPVPPATTPVGTLRCLRVQVTVGGQVRTCDRAVTTLGDSRTCS